MSHLVCSSPGKYRKKLCNTENLNWSPIVFGAILTKNLPGNS